MRTGVLSVSAMTGWYLAVGILRRAASPCVSVSTDLGFFRFAVYVSSVVSNRLRNAGSKAGTSLQTTSQMMSLSMSG